MAKKDTKLKELSRLIHEMADDLDKEGLDLVFFEMFGENMHVRMPMQTTVLP